MKKIRTECIVNEYNNNKHNSRIMYNNIITKKISIKLRLSIPFFD